MPSVAELERLQALINRLLPLGKRQRGDLIQAQEWNVLVSTLIEIAQAVVADETNSTVPPHNHPDQVNTGWLDPRLRSLVERGPLADPTAVAKVAELERRVGRFPEQVQGFQTDLQDMRDRLTVLSTRDLVRESEVTTVRRSLEGMTDAREEVLILRQGLETIRVDVQRAIELGSSLEVGGRPVDLGALMERIQGLEVLRDRLRTPSGELLDAAALERRLTELTNTLVTEAELDVALSSRPGRISPEQITTLQDQLNVNIADRVATVTTQMRQEVQAQLSSHLTTVNSRVTQAVADALPDVSETLLSTLRTEVNTTLQEGLRASQAELDQQLTQTATQLQQSLTQQVGTLIQREIERQLPDRIGSLQTTIATLNQQMERLQGQVTQQQDRIGRLETRTDRGFLEAETARAALSQEVERRDIEREQAIAEQLIQLQATNQTQIEETIAASQPEILDAARTAAQETAAETAAQQVQGATTRLRSEMQAIARNEVTGLRTELSNTVATKAEIGALQTQLTQLSGRIVTRTDLTTLQTQLNRAISLQVDQTVTDRLRRQ